MFQQVWEMKTLHLLHYRTIYLRLNKRFKLGKTRTRNNQLPSIIWNFYYDATKLLQADNYVVIIIRWLGKALNDLLLSRT